MDLSYYISLLPAYSRDLPRFSALAEAVLRQVTDLMALVPEVESGFSFARAAGVQLDALGDSVCVPQQEGWDDETYRTVLLRKLKRCRWDGTNATVKDFLQEGETVVDNCDGTITVSTEEPLPLPAKELLPIPLGTSTNH